MAAGDVVCGMANANVGTYFEVQPIAGVELMIFHVGSSEWAQISGQNSAMGGAFEVQLTDGTLTTVMFLSMTVSGGTAVGNAGGWDSRRLAISHSHYMRIQNGSANGGRVMGYSAIQLK